MDGFDEDDIARAITLSLQESARASASKGPLEVIEIPDDVIEISDDDASDEQDTFRDDDARFEAELRQAIEASKSAHVHPEPEPQSRSTTRESCASGSGSVGVETGSEAPTTRPGSAFLLDRAQMERERLARQRRLRPDVVQEPRTTIDDDDDDGEMDGPPSAKRQRLSSSTSSTANAQVASTSVTRPATSSADATAGSSRTTAATSGETVFWDGQLRQTANAYVDRDKDTIPVFRLSEIIAPKEEIAFAIVSAYVINWPWLYAFFDPKTPVVVVTHDPHGQETIKEVLPEWIKVTPFLRGGRGCMHMKFMLLFYKSGRLRVMVSTANLIELDWRDIENTVWVQDVPLRSSPISHDSKAADFPSVMVRVLRAVNVVPALLNHRKNGHTNLPLSRVEELRMKWDFSKVKVHLVPSIAGKHEGWPKVLQTGHVRLMKAVCDLNLQMPKGKELVLECQGSSIGTYSTQWVNEFHCSARGQSAESWLDQKRAERMKLPYPPFKILFPTLSNVRGTTLGERGGGTMFCRRSQWQAAKFPRDHFYDSRSKRGPGKVLMHSKMIVATFCKSALAGGSGSRGSPYETESETEPESDEDVVKLTPKATTAVGWAYVGSHNFTPSAWGTLSGSSFNPILNITNYELGIVFPLKDEAEVNRVACWERPPRKYGRDDVPWFQEESIYFREE